MKQVFVYIRLPIFSVKRNFAGEMLNSISMQRKLGQPSAARAKQVKKYHKNICIVLKNNMIKEIHSLKSGASNSMLMC